MIGEKNGPLIRITERGLWEGAEKIVVKGRRNETRRGRGIVVGVDDDFGKDREEQSDDGERAME